MAKAKKSAKKAATKKKAAPKKITGRGGYRPNAGRDPLKEEERKKKRNLYINDPDWEKLQRKAKARDLSVSDMILEDAGIH